ncbi:aspartate-ammonia ligase-domain-containing protein [Gaertneriomyces semiglobifer]|nr:aspartate-ammonia ligase-domain-containing protein [Gaertneriomyces semiglobifer]
MGVWTDLRVLRLDYALEALHSVTLGQWDWECVIDDSQKTLDTLKHHVCALYAALRGAIPSIQEHFAHLPLLPDDITFVHADDVLCEYPDSSSHEHEYNMVKKHGAIFLIGIGSNLSNGKPYEQRAPDYDDGMTETGNGYRRLNGDLLEHNPLRDERLELSSMGIRVDSRTCRLQFEELINRTAEVSTEFQKEVMGDRFPSCIGGGVGQSRVYMLLLRAMHIGQVQVSPWTEQERAHWMERSVTLL